MDSLDTVRIHPYISNFNKTFTDSKKFNSSVTSTSEYQSDIIYYENRKHHLQKHRITDLLFQRSEFAIKMIILDCII